MFDLTAFGIKYGEILDTIYLNSNGSVVALHGSLDRNLIVFDSKDAAQAHLDKLTLSVQ